LYNYTEKGLIVQNMSIMVQVWTEQSPVSDHSVLTFPLWDNHKTINTSVDSDNCSTASGGF